MQQISLLIPTHNRHHYLNRILAYHVQSPFRIYIADSTPTPFTFTDKHPRCTYLHLPGKSLTQKLATALQLIETPYVVMCADDDFTLVRGIQACVDFLQNNPSYTATTGDAICYKKASLASGKIQFAAMYPAGIQVHVAQDDPFERLAAFFRSYNTIFYAVHRTSILREAFAHAEAVVNNLFLNEYVTAILPVIRGKIAALPILLQVREYADDSGDKTIANLENALDEGPFQAEYHRFLDNQVSLVAAATGIERAACKQLLHDILMNYALHLKSLKSGGLKTDPTKQIGSIVNKLPVIGNRIIQGYRQAKENKKLQPFIRSEADGTDLDNIRSLIQEFKHDTV